MVVFQFPHVIAEGFLTMRALVLEFLNDKVRALVRQLRLLEPPLAEPDALGTLELIGGMRFRRGLDVGMGPVQGVADLFERTPENGILLYSPLERRENACQAGVCVWGNVGKVGPAKKKNCKPGIFFCLGGGKKYWTGKRNIYLCN